MSALSHLRAFRGLAGCRPLSASPSLHRSAQLARSFGSASVATATGVRSAPMSSTLRPLSARTSARIYPQSLHLSAFHTSAIARADAAPGDIQVDRQRYTPKQLRNIAIIAHVDHGKTTLVDCLLKQAGTRLSADSGERVMDSNALEKERGITILSKCTSVLWNSGVPADGHNGLYRVNIVDTPGHADFGGEVERIMSMVDGVLLVIDATDGPMTQTKFVLRKALAQNLKPVVVINKVDRPTARVGGEVENEVFDLFVSLDATDEQLEYKTVYCSAREGWAVTDLAHPRTSMAPLFDTVLKHVPHPSVDIASPFSMLVTQIDTNQFLGKLLLGRVKTGTVNVGDTLHALDPAADVLEQVRVTKILTRRGVDQIAVETASSGDIISLAGFTTATVNCTLADVSVNKVIPSTPIDPPTLSMTFSVNDSPLSGKEGKLVTSSALRTRLLREAETNVSLKVIESDNKESFAVQGRGELQLGILLEEMRREGYEVSVSPPRVVYRRKDGTFMEEKDGMPLTGEEKRHIEEPLEEVTIEVPQGFSGTIIEKMNGRKGEMVNMTTLSDGRCRMVFVIPTRGLIGYRTEFQHDTAGQGTINNTFHSYTPFMGAIDKTQKGALISIADGVCSAFALDNIQSRGILFVEPGTVTYGGMVIGENSREQDLEVNPVKTKELTNVRSTSKEEKIRLTPPKIMTIEESIAYMRDDEVIEITPKTIRLRKKLLDPTARKSASRRK